MKKIVMAVSVAMLMSGASTAFAANDSMSKNDTAMMKKCQAMSESAMKKNKDCMAMMKKHPDMMNGSGSSGMSGSSGSMNGGMKK